MNGPLRVRIVHRRSYLFVQLFSQDCTPLPALARTIGLIRFTDNVGCGLKHYYVSCVSLITPCLRISPHFRVFSTVLTVKIWRRCFPPETNGLRLSCWGNKTKFELPVLGDAFVIPERSLRDLIRLMDLQRFLNLTQFGSLTFYIYSRSLQV